MFKPVKTNLLLKVLTGCVTFKIKYGKGGLSDDYF